MADVDVLRAEAEARGIKVDGRWGVDRLRAEIEAAQRVDEPEPAGDAPAGDEPEETSSDDDAPAGDETLAAGPAVVEGSGELDGEPVRAGGWINHGDGRGWVLDEE